MATRGEDVYATVRASISRTVLELLLTILQLLLSDSYLPGNPEPPKELQYH